MRHQTAICSVLRMDASQFQLFFNSSCNRLRYLFVTPRAHHLHANIVIKRHHIKSTGPHHVFIAIRLGQETNRTRGSRKSSKNFFTSSIHPRFVGLSSIQLLNHVRAHMPPINPVTEAGLSAAPGDSFSDRDKKNRALPLHAVKRNSSRRHRRMSARWHPRSA
jgi:hypothetical protein